MQGVGEFQAAMAKLDQGMQTEVHRYLASWAEDVKSDAMRSVPVRSGALRNSIYAKVEEWVVNLGAEATYAYFVEYGTRYVGAHRFYHLL